MTAGSGRELRAYSIILTISLGLTACGPAIHNKLEAMEPKERFAQLDSWSTEKLCMGYTNVFVQPETEQQIATILRARGTKVCNTVRGRKEVPSSSQQLIAQVDGSSNSELNAGFPDAQIASNSQTPAARISYETFKPTISIENLHSIVDSVRNYKPKDQFDVGPNLASLIGKTFVAEVKPRPRGPQNEICPGAPSYGYWVDDGHLEISIGGGASLSRYWNGNKAIMRSSGDYLSHASIYSFYCDVSWGTPYQGSNSFGATTKVHVRNETFIAFGFPSSIMGRLGDYWSGKASPERARSLISNVRVRIYGEIGDWNYGRPILCGVQTDEPKLPAAIETNYRGCFVNAAIHRIEIVDIASGSVLKFWSPGGTNHTNAQR